MVRDFSVCMYVPYLGMSEEQAGCVPFHSQLCMHVCGPAVSERGLRISASVSIILGDTYTPLELKWCIKSMPFFLHVSWNQRSY